MGQHGAIRPMQSICILATLQMKTNMSNKKTLLCISALWIVASLRVSPQTADPSFPRGPESQAYMQAQSDEEYVEEQLSKGQWQPAEQRLREARDRTLKEYETGTKDVAEQLSMFDCQLGMLKQVVHGRFSAAAYLYKEGLRIVAKTNRTELVWWESDDLRALLLRWLASDYMATGQLRESLAALRKLSQVNERRIVHMMAEFPTVERDEDVDIGGATLGGITENLVGANLAVSLASRLHFTNNEANELAYESVLRAKGRQNDLVESGTVFFRRQSPDQFAKYSHFLSNTTAFAIDYWINKAEPGRLRSEIDLLKRDAEHTKGSIASLILSAKNARPELPPSVDANMSRVSAKLPARSVLLEYFVFRPYDPHATELNGQFIWRSPRYVVFIIDTNKHLDVIDLGTVTEIDKLIERFRTNISQPNSIKAPKRSGRILAQKIWDPVVRYTGNAHEVFLAADSRLNLVPYGALFTSAHTYLIESVSLHYLNSGRDLLTSGNPQIPRQPPVFAGAPCFDSVRECAREQDQNPQRATCSSSSISNGTAMNSEPTTRLRSFNPVTDIFENEDIAETRREVCDVSKLFEGVTVLLGGDFTEGAIKRVHGPAILHLATHAYYIPTRMAETDRDLLSDETLDIFRLPVQEFVYPEIWRPSGNRRRFGPFLEDSTLELDSFVRSGLALSGANVHNSPEGEDGILTALEVSALDLVGTELVVLSACDTGVSDVVSRGGVAGLRRALSIAGAQSEVISLWSVNDTATRSLMVEYYQRLLHGEGRAEALRNAQLKMLQSGDKSYHPFYWASFIQSGEWTPLGAAALQWGREHSLSTMIH